MRLGIACIGLVLLTACASDAPEQGHGANNEAAFSAARLERLDSVLEDSIADDGIPGAVVLIGDDAGILYQKTYGMADRAAGRSMRPDTMFRLASMSKPVTAVAVMMLYEEGDFLLDDPVAAYLPEFDREMQVVVSTDDGYELVPAKQQITIRHLLTHTAGFGYRFMSPEPLANLYAERGIIDGVGSEDMTLAEFSRRVATAPLAHEPGTGWTYGVSSDVLGRLVEALSGQTFDDFLRERLFEPLDMDDTYFVVPTEKRDRVASVYQVDETGALQEIPGGRVDLGPDSISVDYPFQDDLELRSGGSGLISTAGDYARFLRMLLNGGALDGQRILGPKTVELMFSDQAARYGQASFNGRGYGFGFFVDGGPGVSGQPGSVGVVGWSGLLNTYFWVDPEEDFFAILMTQYLPYNLRMEPLFRGLVYQALLD